MDADAPKATTKGHGEEVKGFFTDVTVCIGCKACEVACKQWNQLPDDGFELTGMSYDNTGALGPTTWRHVAFFERGVAATDDADVRAASHADAKFEWAMMSDVCKHCVRAGCLEACPTGAILRTDHGSVYIQPDVCNGCGYCVSACPFGVVARDDADGRAFKCTLCYDRLNEGMEPACAKACPTDSILFGPVDELRAKAEERVRTLHARGVTDAYLYGARAEEQPGTEGLHAFFLLTHEPEAYNLPPNPVVPTHAGVRAWRSLAVAAAGMVLAAGFAAIAGRGA